MRSVRRGKRLRVEVEEEDLAGLERKCETLAIGALDELFGAV